ncbi:MAG TPA: hypothetical protein VF017_15510 [Thermoanaerobaculia bacterium]|nr:hypothetical protein [Thermoanaerobaculia bacterium]
MWEVRASAEVLNLAPGQGGRHRRSVGAGPSRKLFVFGSEPLYFHSLPPEIEADRLLVRREVAAAPEGAEVHGEPAPEATVARAKKTAPVKKPTEPAKAKKPAKPPAAEKPPAQDPPEGGAS